ncbi:unnamed protein product [Sphacelaria rigidula]
MSVLWVFSNGSYEVSSKNHLLQIMNSGSVFANTGSPPSDYKTASYIQTIDIDLQSDSTNIVPISPFSGSYDGQGFAISNWNCVPPSGKGTGLFGTTNGATVQNVVLNGVWRAIGTNDGCFLSAHNTNSSFYNITADFAPGTEITATANSLGGLFSYTGGGTFENITLGGTIDRFEGVANTGGIIGFSGYGSGANTSHIRNIANFTNGIVNTGSNVGGVYGTCIGDTVSHVLNAMRGPIQGGSGTSGGIFGTLSNGSVNYMMNSSIGNITGGTAASIAATVSGSGTCTHWINYMTGDVTSGLVGTATSTIFLNCIVAMNGVTTYAAFQSGHSSSQILLDASYGITYNTNLGTVFSTTDTSTFESNGVLNLLYWEFSPTIAVWPIVFDTSTLDVLGLLAVPGVFLIELSWTELPGASYRVEYTGTDGSEGAQFTSQTSTTIESLTPDTEYEVTLYSSDGGPFVKHGKSKTANTLQNLAANYDITDFHDSAGTTDLSSLSVSDFQHIDQHLNDLVSTGESIVLTTPTGVLRATFVKLGDTHDATASNGIDNFMLPFSPSLGSGQTSTIYTGTTNLVVTYDEANDRISINGDPYSYGQGYIVNGKKSIVRNL